MIQQMAQFAGLLNDYPNSHFISFLELCDIFKLNGVLDDALGKLTVDVARLHSPISIVSKRDPRDLHRHITSGQDQVVKYGADIEPCVEDHNVPYKAGDVTLCATGPERGNRGKNKIAPSHEIEEDRPLIHIVGDRAFIEDDPKYMKVVTTTSSIMTKHLLGSLFQY
ncbi:Integrase-like protein [Quillaja saponaria]|uniref:Integrase-like protein n=1 Tax=Quillaja saponaria TaxID=32244 RepID=A0AAD7VDD9_QUISA|nr:Integrase-like protein [Quillaja saponaria]